MKRWVLIVCGFSLTAFPGGAALRFGLGNAVAKRSAELINQSGASNVPVGDNVAVTLPSCPAGAVYDSLPTDLSLIAAIDPLGHVAPSPHTFPSDHIYFYQPSGSGVTAPIYAPGTIHVTSVRSSEVLSASPVYTDYSIYFYACRELKSYYFHVKTLSASLQSQVGAIDQNCTTYTTGGTFHACEKQVNITVQSGEVLGYSSTSGAFDFGSYDYRRTPLAWVSPSRHQGDQPYTVCPIDYFTPGLKASMEAMLGLYDGTHPRTTAPICGQIMYDVAGTAKGAWYYPGAPDVPEDPHLSLIDNNVFAPWQTISIGDSLPNQSQAFYMFIPISGGGVHVDRDFSEVTADGTIYCYDTFLDPGGNPSGGPTILIQLLTPTTLRIESQSAINCAAAAPFTFTANAVDFQR